MSDVIESILRLLDLDANDRSSRNRSGSGLFDAPLIERAGKVWAVEIDAALIERLRASDFAAQSEFDT